MKNNTNLLLFFFIILYLGVVCTIPIFCNNKTIWGLAKEDGIFEVLTAVFFFNCFNFLLHEIFKGQRDKQSGYL